MQNFNKVLDTLIPLVPIYKKEDVDGYFECAIRLHNKLCAKTIRGEHRFKRSTLSHMYRAQPALALKFIVALEANGYFDCFTERTGKKTVKYCMPTEKLYSLYKSVEPPDKFTTYPINDVDASEVRRGITQKSNSFAMSSIAQPYFTINSFIYNLLLSHPLCSDNDPRFMAHKRAMSYARIYSGREFRFPWFRDSRGRACIKSTVGFSPQGCDSEKALVIPTRTEQVSETGAKAMIEAALAYAEKDLTKQQIIDIVKDPEGFKEEWQSFDKPYCFMAMADLIRQYDENPTTHTIRWAVFWPSALDSTQQDECNSRQNWNECERA